MNTISIWKPELASIVKDIGAEFRRGGISHYVLLQPTPLYFPYLEEWGPGQAYVPEGWGRISAVYQSLFAGAADGVIDAGPAMEQAERSPDRRLLYLSDGEYQPSAAGDALLARLVFDRLAADRPWKGAP